MDFDYNDYGLKVEEPITLADDNIKENLDRSSMDIIVLVGVLVGLVVLNLFYRFFLQKCLESRRNSSHSKGEPRVITVKIPTEGNVKNTNLMLTNEKSVEIKDKSEINYSK